MILGEGKLTRIIGGKVTLVLLSNFEELEPIMTAAVMEPS